MMPPILHTQVVLMEVVLMGELVFASGIVDGLYHLGESR